MKKLIALLGIVAILGTATVFAQEAATTVSTGLSTLNVIDALQKAPALKQGFAYSIVDSKFNYMSTFDVANYKGFNLEVGYAGAAQNTGDKVVAVASYDLLKAKDLGVNIPILDLIVFRPGIYAGVGRINISDMPGMRGNNELDYGVSATIIDVKF